MSQRRNQILAAIVIIGFIGFVIWSTFGAQSVECEVCMEFNGRRNCAVASGGTPDAAAETAQNTACGPVTNGMNDAIACGNIAPASRVCRTR